MPGFTRRSKGDPFVLLLSDRPAERSALARAVTLVMPCHAPDPTGDLPPERPHVVVLDLAPTHAAAVEARLVVSGPPVPRLILTRGAVGAPAEHLRYLPAASPRQTILAGIFALIEAVARADEAQARRLRARCAAATGVVAELFDSAALEARLQRADLDRGADLVLDAVSEAGISDWLAEVWRHDSGVYQHTLSVAGHAAAFGGGIGLSRLDLARLARAALLHDIGKARIPPEILNKAGPLDPVEIRLMRRHPEIGAALLEAQGGFEAEVIDVVRHHHERVDGAGYPDGLAGPAVSDLVRIVAICDVFSALTERRPYRRPLSAPEALAMMAEGQGHLDPDLLHAFASTTLGRAAAVA